MKFHEMTWPELRALPRDQVLVMAPIAACEQHGHHLATFTDTILCTGVADGIEKRLPKSVLQLPTMWMGASHHHLRYGATLSASVDTHVDMLCDILLPLLDDGYQRLMFLNGHGGNIDTMKMALRRLQNTYPQRQVTAASYWDLAEKEFAEIAEGGRRLVGHACEIETSMLLALRPDLVRKDKIQDDPPVVEPVLRGLYLSEDMYQRTQRGAVGFPERATAEKGQRWIQAAVDRAVEVIEALLKRPMPK